MAETTKELIAYFRDQGHPLAKAAELALRYRAQQADKEHAAAAAERIASLPDPSPLAIFRATVAAGVAAGLSLETATSRAFARGPLTLSDRVAELMHEGKSLEEATSAAYTMADPNVTDPKPFPTHHGEVGAGADQRRGDREMIVETVAAISDRLRREHPEWSWEKVASEAYRIEHEQLARAVGATSRAYAESR